MRLVLLSLLAPSIAAANAVDVNVNVDVHVQPGPVYEPPPPLPPVPRLAGSRWELGAFLEGGRVAMGDLTGGQIGIRGEIARQFGPLRLGLEGSFAKFQAERDLYTADGWWDGWEDVGGEVSRIGATARMRSVHVVSPATGATVNADVGFYIEGGVGKQRIAFDRGMSHERTDLMLGIGLECAGGQGHMGGFDLNVRAMLTPSLNAAVETHDVIVLVGLGGRFGS